MRQNPPVGWLALAGILALAAGCATGPDERPRLDLGIHSERLALPVNEDGAIHLAHQPPLSGILDLSPVLDEEEAAPGRVQILLHRTELYLTADGFANVWRLSPDAGEGTAAYEGFSTPGGALERPRLSRYGSGERACVRVDQPDAEPLFVTPSGEVRDACP